jgi:multidrug efflux pump subunit AcrA (membrane-fusion protein)
LGILIFLWAGLFLFSCTTDKEEEAGKKKREFALPVQVGKVVYMDVVDQIRTVGNIRAEQRVMINAEVEGQITSIPVVEGRQVKQGDVLALIDTREYKLEMERLRSDLEAFRMEYEKALEGLRPEEKERLEAQVKADESALDLANKEQARISSLVADGVLAQSALDNVDDRVRQAEETLRSSQAALAAGMRSREEDIVQKRSQMEVIEKRLAKAELDLSKAMVRAPFDGVILSKEIEQGAYVGAGTPILEMIGSSKLKAVLEVPQGYRSRLQKLQGAEFLVRELDLRFKHGRKLARHVRVIPDANIYSGNIKVQIDLPDPDPALFPGLTLESRLNFGTRRNVLHVPSVSLVISEQGTLVYIVKEMKAHRVPVKAFKERDEFVEIEDFTHQLGPEADLILRGSGAVFPGANVILTNPEPEAETPFNAASKKSGKNREISKAPET